MKFKITGSALAEGLLPQEVQEQVSALFPVDFRNARRAGTRAGSAMTTGALALFRAGKKPSDAIAVIGIGTDGALPENLRYRADYLQNGRTAGRGHLFVGTLPSTPVCETAIALSLHGPAWYTTADPAEEISARLDDGAEGVLLIGPRGALFAEPAKDGTDAGEDETIQRELTRIL